MNMKMRNSALEKVAVKKVKHEVDVIIEEARTKLEEYVEEDSNIEYLAEVSNSLSQVERTLQLVQINGAAVLAREMFEVVDSLINESITQKDKAHECLSRGILQMSDYLEYVQAGNKDLPVVLLPLLNDLRGVREAPLLSENILFFPDFDDIEVPSVNVRIDMSARDYAKKIRYGFQTGLVSLIQNKEIDVAATKMCKVAIRLHQCSFETAARRLWWVSSAIAQALAIEALPTSTGLASLLGQVDRQIKQFIDLEETEFAAQIPSGLIKNLLYYVGIADERGRIVSKVKKAYGLDDLIPSEMDINKMREGLSGPNADVLEAVSKALHEDIETVKDSIELYVHSKNRSSENVREVGKELQKIADTLSMLGLDEPREDVLREVTALNGLSAEELEHADSNFISIAETLIKAENIVDNFVNYRILNKPAVQLVDSSEGSLETSEDDSNQLRKIQVQTLTEALGEIEEAKNIFAQVLTEPEDRDKYAQVQDHFRKVMGAVSILNLDNAAKMLECIQAYLLGGDAAQELSSNQDMLDAFADSITSVECYLEALIVDEGDPKDILEYGIKNASKLVGGKVGLSIDSEPIQTVEVEELAHEDSSPLSSSADLELKKKSEISAQEPVSEDTNNDLNNSGIDLQQEASAQPNNKVPLDEELDLEELSATSLDLSFDYDLLDSDPAEPNNDSSKESLSQDLSFEAASSDEVSLDMVAADEGDKSDASQPVDELSPELLELESTSIEEAATELNSIVNEDFAKDIDVDTGNGEEAVGVVEVDLDATNMLDLNEIEEELSTNAKAYDLNKLDEVHDKDVLSIEEDSGETELLLPEEMSEVNEQGVEVDSEDDNMSAYSITISIDGDDHVLHANRGEADKDVIEIFIEEAEEEIEKINLNKDIWRTDEDNEDALVIVRRSFHTLKGGGRLVGAEIIGEYAWQIENILNKVIDNALVVNIELHHLLENSVTLLNELILQLKMNQEPISDVKNLFIEAQNFLDTQSQQSNSQDSAIQTNIEVLSIDVDEIEAIEQDKVQEDIQTDESQEIKSEPQQSVAQDDLSDELYSLFLEEAMGHIQFIDEIIEPKKEHKILLVDDKILHALHTLFGCSRTAQVEAVAKLIGPLDKYCQELKQNKQKLKDEQFDVFVDCIEYVKKYVTENPQELKTSTVNTELLEKVKNLNIVENPELDEVVTQDDLNEESKHETEDGLEKTQIATLSDTNFSAADLSQSADVYEGKDADLVEIFLEEASDILDTCNECLDKWRNNHKDENSVSEFRRQLHTLKGSARMAAYSNIGDFSHIFESLVIDIAEARIQASDEVFNLVQRCLDHLNEMIDLAANKQPIFSATRLTAELEALRSGESFTAEELSEPTEVKEKIEDKSKERINTEADKSKVVKIPVLRNPIDPNKQSNSSPSIVSQQSVRLQSNVLDNLVNNAGEVNIFQARLEQVSNTYNVNIYELEQIVNRLREQLRNLEIETETQILSRHAHEVPEQEDFDPLELDRYSNIQQLSRSLAESVNDLLSIKDILSDQVRESEILLSQQRRISGDLQEGLMRTRMVPFNQLVPRLQRIVRQTSRELSKEADLKVIGQNTEVDSSILNRIIAPLEHLVRNAISHGIEEVERRESANKAKQGEIKIEVKREGAEIVIVVSDDGAGLNVEKIKNKAKELGLLDDEDLSEREALNLILRPGFSTAGEVSQVSGRGVGMDVVASELKQMGGSLQIDSVLGEGAIFTIHIPFTLAITQSLLIKCANEIYGIPLASVEGVVRLSAHELKQKYAEEQASYHYADRNYRLCHLGSLLGVNQPQLDGADKMFPVLLVRSGDSRMAIHVETTLGNHEIVVKPLAAQLSRLPVVSGATILGDGNVVLILDVPGLIRMDGMEQSRATRPSHDETTLDSHPTIMVVDDSITIRKVTTRFLERNNYKVATAKDGIDAVQKLQDFTPALILLDIEMPRMDGYELATHVRNNERLKDVPIIMITSRTGDKHRQRAEDIGVQKYLGKPYNESELLNYVKEVVK